MTVRELKNVLDKLPSDYDGYKVVSLQPTVESYFDGNGDSLKFTGFDDIELKRVNILEMEFKIRIN